MSKKSGLLEIGMSRDQYDAFDVNCPVKVRIATVVHCGD